MVITITTKAIVVTIIQMVATITTITTTVIVTKVKTLITRGKTMILTSKIASFRRATATPPTGVHNSRAIDRSRVEVSKLKIMIFLLTLLFLPKPITAAYYEHDSNCDY